MTTPQEFAPPQDPALIDALEDAANALESEASRFINTAQPGEEAAAKSAADDNEHKTDVLRSHARFLRETTASAPPVEPTKTKWETGMKLHLCNIGYIEDNDRRLSPEAIAEIREFASHLRDHRDLPGVVPTPGCRFCDDRTRRKAFANRLSRTRPASRR